MSFSLIIQIINYYKYQEESFMRSIRIVNKHIAPSLLTIGLLLLASCAKQPKDKDEMGFDELKKNSLVSLEKKKYDEAAKHLERIVAKYPEHENAHKHKLALADTYFKMGKYPAAEKIYSHYSNYYPSDPKAEYARYKSIRSQFYQTLRVDCDQTATEQTIKLCNTYKDNANFQKYSKDVTDIQNTCEHKLINKEIYVYNFYLKQQKFDAAQNRLDYLRTNFLDKKKSIEPRVLYLECKLAQRQKKTVDLEQKLEQLFSKFPQSQYTRMAQSLVTRGKFRF